MYFHLKCKRFTSSSWIGSDCISWLVSPSGASPTDFGKHDAGIVGSHVRHIHYCVASVGFVHFGLHDMCIKPLYQLSKRAPLSVLGISFICYLMTATASYSLHSQDAAPSGPPNTSKLIATLLKQHCQQAARETYKTLGLRRTLDEA